VNILSEIIGREAAQRGVLPFARFMELALYCPVHGYYETKTDNTGRHGDFYTSVGVGELFGQLLAFQFAEWLETLDSQALAAPKRSAGGSSLNLVEAGAHDGQLAKDILAWLQLKRPKLFEQIEYWVIEPSPRRQKWQKETLKNFAPRVRWFAGFQELVGRDSAYSGVAATRLYAVKPAQPSTLNPQLHGVIFSNELLDSMPVHRLGWDAKNKKWFEWGVAVDGEKFVWARIPDTLAPQSGKRIPRTNSGFELLNRGTVPGSAGVSPASSGFRLPTGRRDAGAPRRFMESAGARGFDPSSILHLPSSLQAVLPDGYTIEICPAAESWWREAAQVLGHGKLLTIDYGFTADELFSPGRMHGTLRAYFRHHASDDLLANVGVQDLTAHVNFSEIQKVGEACGLVTETFSTQAQFLTRILEKTLRGKSFGELVSPKPDGGGSEDGWTSAQARQFQTLTHPEHLGRGFHVLVQSK